MTALTSTGRSYSDGLAGLRESPAALAPPFRPRLSLAAVGLLLVLLSGLGGLLWARSVAGDTPVLVLARDVEAGETVSARDLAVARVSVGDGVRVVPASRRAALSGRVATTQLAKGSLLAPDQLADALDLVPGEAIVAVALRPVDAPTASLRPGSTVRLVETPPGGSAMPAVVVERAVVFAVAEPPASSSAVVASTAEWSLSLRVPEATAPAVVAAAAEDRLRLVLIGAS